MRAVLGFRVHGPHGMDDPPRPEVAPGGGHGPAGGQAVRVCLRTDPLALVEDPLPSLAVDGAVHAAPAHERGVRRVHDGVRVLLSDIPPLQDDSGWGHTAGAHLLPVGPAGGSRRTTAGNAP